MNIATAICLEGTAVRLEALRREHGDMFWDVAQNALDDIFRWIPYPMKTREDFARWLDKAFAEQPSTRNRASQSCVWARKRKVRFVATL